LGQDVKCLIVKHFDSWIEHWNIPKWTLEILMLVNLLSRQWTWDYLTHSTKLLIPTTFIWAFFIGDNTRNQIFRPCTVR
jgi:hypothetical protein